VARAKRTERTDARRRHRADAASQAEPTGAEAASDVATSGTTKAQTSAGKSQAPAKQGQQGQQSQQQRPGFTQLMKSAYRSPNIIEDFKSLPVVLMNPGLLIAVVGSIAISIWFCLAYNTAVSQVPIGDTAGLQAVSASYQIPAMLMGMVISPPPAVGAFLIGFMAKRASWLGGLIYGILCTIIVILVLQQPAGRLFTGDQDPMSIITSTAAWSPVGAALFAAAAAWYKRFLNLSNPNRARAEAEKKSASKQPAGRGNVKTNYRSGGTR
jgi:hypothetical protein